MWLYSPKMNPYHIRIVLSDTLEVQTVFQIVKVLFHHITAAVDIKDLFSLSRS